MPLHTELEKRIGVSQGYLTRRDRISSGSTMPADTLYAISNELGVSMDLLVSEHAFSSEEEMKDRLSGLLRKTISGVIHWEKEKRIQLTNSFSDNPSTTHPLTRKKDDGVGYTVFFKSIITPELRVLKIIGNAYKCSIGERGLLIVKLQNEDNENHTEPFIELDAFELDNFIPTCSSYKDPNLASLLNDLYREVEYNDSSLANAASFYIIDELLGK